MAENKSVGNWGEHIVRDYLITHGYAIMETNWRLNHLEVDIIVSKGDEIAFVEVKTRREPFRISEIITPRKISNLVSAANGYLRRFHINLRPRFDVAAIVGTEHSYTLEYIPDAFRPPLRTHR